MRKSTKSLLGACLALGSITSSFAQETQIKFFGQPEFGMQNETNTGHWVGNPNAAFLPAKYQQIPVWNGEKYSDSTKSAFSQGNYVLFVTSQLTDRISVLSENTVTVVNRTPTFDIKRLLAKVYYKDYLSFSVGKMFNPIGIWNNQFNMGLVLQPTIQRPISLRAADDKGVLQINNTGVQIEGNEITSLGGYYRLFICNGSNSTSRDNNFSNKYAVTSEIGIKPIDGLNIALSAHHDYFAANTPNSARVTTTKGGSNTLYNLAIAYFNPEKKVEFIAEATNHVSNYDSLGSKSSMGIVGYAGYKVTNKLIPYVQAMYAQVGSKSKSDYYFLGQLDGVYATLTDISLGLRYKLSANFVIKAEYNFYNLDQIFVQDKFAALNSGLAALPAVAYNYVPGDKHSIQRRNGLRLQFAFAF